MDAAPDRHHRPHRPYRHRVGVTVGLASAIVATSALLLVVEEPQPPVVGAAAPEPVAFSADLEPALSCDLLLASYVERGVELVGPWGWSGGPVWTADFPINTAVAGDIQPLAARGVADGKVQRQESSATGTNVQEAAVDEPDSVKTDGRLLVTLRDDLLRVWDVSGATPSRLARLDLPDLADGELLLDGDTVVVVGSDDHGDWTRPDTRILTVSLADPTRPEVVDDLTYGASLASARQHGSTVRVVLASGLPEFGFAIPGRKRTRQEALDFNRQVVRDSTIDDWLPDVTADGSDRSLLDCDDVAIPSDDLGLGTMSIVGFETTDATATDAIAVAGHTDLAYESADHLYLATRGGWRLTLPCGGRCVADTVSPVAPVGPPGGTAQVLAFDLDGTTATHVASGAVEGELRDRWSLDEDGGVLRLAVGPSSATTNANAVVTLARDGAELVELGRLDGLGRGEDIQSVRWFDDLAIVVTFRQVDPLYSVDLTDPAAPRLRGELKIPGFSSYLHPLDDSLLVGVGEGPDGHDGWGAQVGLFDVRDTTDVRRTDLLSYGAGTRALAGQDPRAFTWLPEQDTFITVVESWGSRRVGHLSVIRLEGEAMEETRTATEYGDDVDQLRAVPLPDGRVVVVTGEDVRFLAL